MKITEGKNKKRILEEKESTCITEKNLRTVNLIAPVIPKTGGAFDFNPQYPTAGNADVQKHPNKVLAFAMQVSTS